MNVKTIEFALGGQRIALHINEARRMHGALDRLFDIELADPEPFKFADAIVIDEDFLPRGWKKVNAETVRVVK